MGKIASKANVNHRLIFHHFGNKEGLWRAVKQNIVEESNKLSPTTNTNQSQKDFLKAVIKYRIYRNNPPYCRMINCND